MKKRIVFAMVGIACMALPLVHADTPAAQPGSPGGLSWFYTTETVVVDEVLSANDNGYRSNAYVVAWNNSRVAVEDTLARTSYRVGDRIKILVMRHELDAKTRTLHFAVAPEKARCTKPGRGTVDAAPPVTGRREEGSGCSAVPGDAVE